MSIAVNDVIQIVPEHQWGGCLAIVSELKSFGCQAYVEVPFQGAAHIRLKFDDFEYIGTAAFAKAESDDL